jgi:hypothetical protein
MIGSVLVETRYLANATSVLTWYPSFGVCIA